MNHRRSSLILIGIVYILCLSAQNSFALVYTGGTGHDTAPTGNAGWDNVGVMSIGSGAYLGDGWVLAPYHVYQYNPSGGRYVDLDQRYYEIPDTAHRIKYTSSINADLMMFRINGAPDVPLVELSSSTPVNQEVTIIASGRSRVGDLVDFDGGLYQGYNTTSSRVKRWGRNVTGLYTSATSSTFGRTNAFMTSFDNPGLGDDECQPVNNDSGGSVFIKSGESWELAGLALSVGGPYSYTGNITTAPVYGAYAKYADMATYRTQINEIRLIPLAGDADWDGDVDNTDIAILLMTFGQSGSDLQADFNDDNTVNLADFTILRRHFGLVSGGMVPGAENLSVQVVPEPATLVLLCGAVPFLIRRARQRR